MEKIKPFVTEYNREPEQAEYIGVIEDYCNQIHKLNPPFITYPITQSPPTCWYNLIDALALEACKKQKEGNKTIELNAYRRENMFFIIIKNSFDGTLTKIG